MSPERVIGVRIRFWEESGVKNHIDLVFARMALEVRWECSCWLWCSHTIIKLIGMSNNGVIFGVRVK